MPIIYTYPSATPTANDLLIFSDVSNTDPKNATRKCTINDLVALMPTVVPGGGTVTTSSVAVTGTNSTETTTGTIGNVTASNASSAHTNVQPTIILNYCIKT